MAYQQIPGKGILAPAPPLAFGNFSPNSALIDATGEKVAMMGRVFWQGRSGTKDIRKVGFRFGTVTKTGGSGLTVSLQDVDAANGPPMQPDGTPDETVAVANSDSDFATNTWYQTGNLSADRTVAFGELLAVVVEYDGSGRQGSDAVNITSLAQTSGPYIESGVSLYTSSWAQVGFGAPLILEFSDGTFGTLEGAFPVSTWNTPAFHVNSNPDEYGNQFVLPFACKVDGAWAQINIAGASADFEVILYENTTPLVTLTVDANMIPGTGVTRYAYFQFPLEVELEAGTPYIIALRPTTTGNMTVSTFNVNANGHFQAHDLGDTCYLVTRTNQGAWSESNTRRLLAGIRISSLDDGAGGGSSFAMVMEG